jgi:hypothetical protein
MNERTPCNQMKFNIRQHYRRVLLLTFGCSGASVKESGGLETIPIRRFLA